MKIGFVKEKMSNRIHGLAENKHLYIMMIPGLLLLFIFCYIPMVGIIIAFQDFSPIKLFASKFVGLQNFAFFFTNGEWISITLNTLFLNVLFIITGIFMQIMIAVMLNEIGNAKFKKVSQTFMLLPYFISWPIVAMMSVAFISTDTGVINTVLKYLGSQPINFYQDSGIWPLVLVIIRIWKSTGYGVIIYLAAITGIQQDIYEAAKIDGASRIQCITKITIPLLTNITILLLLLAVGRIFYGDFGMIYALIGDNSLLYSTTDVIDTFVFRALRVRGDMGMAAAVGLYQSVIGFIFVFTCNKITKKYNAEASLF